MVRAAPVVAAAPGDELVLAAGDHAGPVTLDRAITLRGEPGVIGHDEENGDVLTAIAFDRIKGGKPFNIDLPWFGQLLKSMGQTQGAKMSVKH